MDIQKATRLVGDQTGKTEHDYFESLKAKSKIIVDCAQTMSNRRPLLIVKSNGDTAEYTWNGCKHYFDCTYIHNNKKQIGYYTKLEAIENIAIDLYQNAEYKFI